MPVTPAATGHYAGTRCSPGAQSCTVRQTSLLPEQKIDDRFITDYDPSIIGYGKKSSFTTLIPSESGLWLYFNVFHKSDLCRDINDAIIKIVSFLQNRRFSGYKCVSIQNST